MISQVAAQFVETPLFIANSRSGTNPPSAVILYKREGGGIPCHDRVKAKLRSTRYTVGGGRQLVVHAIEPLPVLLLAGDVQTRIAQQS